MAIVVDFTQIFIFNITSHLGKGNKELDKNIVRHMVMNSLRIYNKKYKRVYGDMVLCTEGRDNWRKTYFEHYKGKRKTAQKKSPLDWDAIFNFLAEILAEIREYLPYKVINVPEAEGDDVVAIIAKYEASLGNKSMIISMDKDFIQLISKHISIYRPLKNEEVSLGEIARAKSEDNPLEAFFE